MKIILIDQVACVLNPENNLRRYTSDFEIITEEQSEDQLIEKTKDADIVLCDRKTKLTSEVLQSCEKLKYIGICATNTDNVDLEKATQLGIKYTNVSHYGDESTAEYVIAQIFSILKGLGRNQWKETAVDVAGKKLGIIGMGGVGTLLANLANKLGMNVYGYNRSPKEVEGVTMLSFDELLKTADIISIHVPKNVLIMNKNEFNKMGNGKIFINSSLGICVDIDAVKERLSDESNIFVVDQSVDQVYIEELSDYPNVEIYDKIGGNTQETLERLQERVRSQLEEFLSK